MANGISGYGLQVGGKGISSTAGSIGSGIRSPKISASDFAQRRVPRDKLIFWCMSENGSRARSGVKDAADRTSLIRDFSGDRNHLRQSTNARKPTGITYEGEKAFYFDASDISSSQGVTEFDFFTGDFTVVLAAYATVQSGVRAVLTNKADVSSASGFVVGRLGQKWTFRVIATGGTSAITTSSNHSENWNVVFARRSGTNMTLQVWTDGSLAEEVSETKTARSANGVQLSMGAFLDRNNDFKGGVAEAYVYDKALSTVEQNRILTYMAAKFA
jgi:hypothetical protein